MDMDTLLYGIIIAIAAALAYFFMGSKSVSDNKHSGGAAEKCVKGYKCDGNVCTKCE